MQKSFGALMFPEYDPCRQFKYKYKVIVNSLWVLC
jgi:hypothetical protein